MKAGQRKNADRDTEVLKRWNRGETNKDIAIEMHITRGVVAGIIDRAGDLAQKRPSTHDQRRPRQTPISVPLPLLPSEG